jgi:hypothetical protein
LTTDITIDIVSGLLMIKIPDWQKEASSMAWWPRKRGSWFGRVAVVPGGI